MRMRIGIVIASLVLAAAGPALATDGVIEINRTRVLAGGITPEDVPGFPATLSRTGRYRLTGNLTTGSKAVTAIEITAANVDLDLNGFTVACALQAGFITPLCLPGTSGKGVAAGSATRVHIANGTVVGMGSNGIELGAGGRVEAVDSSGNGATGIFSTESVTVLDSRVASNGGQGVLLGTRSIVARTTALANTSTGISVGHGSTVSHSIAEGNSTGIRVTGGSTVSDSSVSSNSNFGIEATTLSSENLDGVVVRGCSVSANGIGVFVSSPGSLLIGNAITANAGLGVILNFLGGYRENVLVGNNGGQEIQLSAWQAGSTKPADLGSNYCGSDTICP